MLCYRFTKRRPHDFNTCHVKNVVNTKYVLFGTLNSMEVERESSLQPK